MKQSKIKMRAQITTPHAKTRPAPLKTEEATKKRGYLPLFIAFLLCARKRALLRALPPPVIHAPSNILQYLNTAESASNVSRETNTIRKTIMFHVKQQYATKTSMFHVKHSFFMQYSQGILILPLLQALSEILFSVSE